MHQHQPPHTEPAAIDDPDPSPPPTITDSDETPHDVSRNVSPRDAAVLRYRNQRIVLSGRILSQVLWLAAHGSTINDVAAESGQLWLTWKGNSIAGEIRTRL